MKSTSRLQAAIIAIALSATTVTPAYAQAAIASELGKKVAGQILGAILGKGLDAIFGGEETGLTQEDLANAIAKGFNQAARDAIDVDVDALARNLADYAPATDYANSNTSLDNWRGQAVQIQSQIATHMSEGNFMTFLPSYITAANTRMALLAEIRRSQYASTGNEEAAAQRSAAIVGAAEEAIREVALFFEEDFHDDDLSWRNFRDGGECLHKVAADQFYMAGIGKPLGNRLGGQFGVIDVSTEWCPKTQGQSFMDGPFGVGSTPDVWKVIQSGIYKVPGREVYSFVYKRPINADPGYQWVYRTYPTLVSARIERAAGSVDMYPNKIGDIRGQIQAWFDIVMHSGTGQQKLAAAQRAFLFLDHRALASEVPGFGAWYSTTAVPMITGQ